MNTIKYQEIGPERNYKSLHKDIQEVLNKWKSITNLCAGSLNIARCHIFPTQFINLIQIKEPT